MENLSSNKPLLSERKSKQKEEVKSSIADLVLSKSNLDSLNKNTEYFDSIIIKPVIVPVANFNVAEVQSNYSTPTSSVSAFSNSEQSFKILEVELASSDEEVEETLLALKELYEKKYITEEVYLTRTDALIKSLDNKHGA